MEYTSKQKEHITHKLLKSQTIRNRKLRRKYIIPKISVIKYMEEIANK